MAQVNIEEIIEYLDTDIRKALAAAVEATIPNAEFDARDLYREFCRQVGKKCGAWEDVPDSAVKGR